MWHLLGANSFTNPPLTSTEGPPGVCLTPPPLGPYVSSLKYSPAFVVGIKGFIECYQIVTLGGIDLHPLSSPLYM